MNWRWLSKPALLLLHGESLSIHGGREGLRDEGLLDLALSQPQAMLACADPAAPPDVAALAASYAVGLARSRPLMDGNKRAAFLATGVFLYLNGYRLNTTQADAAITMGELVGGGITESEFADWLRARATLG